MLNKKELSRQILEKRNELSREQQEEFSLDITEAVLHSSIWNHADSVLIYASFRSEVSTWKLIETGIAQGKGIYCPRIIDRTKHCMEFYELHSQGDLVEGSYGIYEPLEKEEMRYREQKESDLILLPGAVFDYAGNRIGYHGGYYDRYLEVHPHLIKAGLCYSLQLLQQIPAFVHDIPMNFIFTEKGLWKIPSEV